MPSRYTRGVTSLWWWILALAVDAWCILDGNWIIAAVAFPIQLWLGRESLRRLVRSRQDSLVHEFNRQFALMHRTRWQRWRGVVLLGAAWLAFRMLGEVWGRSTLVAVESTARDELLAERARRAEIRMPAVGGAGMDEDAAPIEREALARFSSFDERGAKAFLVAARAGFEKPPPREVEARLASLEPALADLRRSARCTRCFWELAEPTVDPPAWPKFQPARAAGAALVLEGHARARRGQYGEAARSYLASFRLGADLALYDLGSYALGSAIDLVAIDALGALVVSMPRRSTREIAEIAGEVAALESAVPHAARAFRTEQLGNLAFTRECSKGFFGGETTFGSVACPERALFAHACTRRHAMLDELVRATETGDRRERDATAARVAAAARASWNPTLRILMENAPDMARFELELLTKVRLVEGALSLERAYESADSYFVQLDLPDDPLAPGRRLLVSTDGETYSISSAGDGMSTNKKEYVLERRR